MHFFTMLLGGCFGGDFSFGAIFIFGAAGYFGAAFLGGSFGAFASFRWRLEFSNLFFGGPFPGQFSPFVLYLLSPPS